MLRLGAALRTLVQNQSYNARHQENFSELDLYQNVSLGFTNKRFNSRREWF